MKRLLTCATLAMMLLAGIAAPQLCAATYTWSQYDLTFETPDGGFVRYSTSTYFEVQWDEMVVTITLYSKGNSDSKTISSNLMRKSLDYSMYDTRQDKMKVKGFKTQYIEGTMPNGSRAVIADLVSDNQDLVIEVMVNYLFGNREVVDDIIKSFAQGKQADVKKEKNRKQKVQSREDALKQQQQQQKKQQKQQQQQQQQQLQKRQQQQEQQEQERRREEERQEKLRNKKTYEA